MNKKVKKSILIIILLSFIGAGAASYFYQDHRQAGQPQADWVSYSSQDDRFKIDFPREPQESKNQITIAGKDITYHEFATEHKNVQYAVHYLDFPGHWKLLGVNKLLSKSFDMLVEGEPGIEQVLEKNLSDHFGLPALDYSFTQAGKEVKGKFIIVGNTLYRIAVTQPANSLEASQLNEFFQSFEIG